jgi:predicted hotdog family 3-hydroxylacyl-ACP dehydratase
MVMIDRLTFADNQKARGELTLRNSNLFCEMGKFREAGMTEFIAQTAAAWLGLKNRIGNIPVREGYIGAVKNLEIYGLAESGTVIESEIILENEIVGYTIITGRVMQEGRILASCEMRILERV